MIKVKATRTDAYTGVETEVSVTLILDSGKHGPVVRITDGSVTGFESFYLKEEHKQANAWPSGWCACAGTSRRWDRLVIPQVEMVRAIAELIGNSLRVTEDIFGNKWTSM